MYLDPQFTFHEDEQLTMGLLGGHYQGVQAWQIINNADPGNMEQYEVEKDDIFGHEDVIGSGSYSNCYTAQHDKSGYDADCSIKLGKYLTLYSTGVIHVDGPNSKVE